MKINKATNTLNAIYSFLCILSILLSFVGFLSNNLIWYNAAATVLIISTLLPFGPIACIVGLIYLIINHRKTDFIPQIAKWWIWIVSWFIVVIILWLGAVCTLIGLSGGV